MACQKDTMKLGIARRLFPEFTFEKATIKGEHGYQARCYRLRWEMFSTSLTQLCIDIVARAMKTAQPDESQFTKSLPKSLVQR